MEIAKFSDLQAGVAKQFARMSSQRLYRTSIDPDVLWEMYLASWPAGYNEVYKTRREHDCTCCKQFIRNIGNVVNIVNGKLVTIWDDVFKHTAHQAVAEALASLVRSAGIAGVYLHYAPVVGTVSSRQLLDDKKSVVTWDHFHVYVTRLQAGRADMKLWRAVMAAWEGLR